MTTNFAKTLVWKQDYDVKLWRHKQRTTNTNDYPMSLNYPPPWKLSAYATAPYVEYTAVKHVQAKSWTRVSDTSNKLHRCLLRVFLGLHLWLAQDLANCFSKTIAFHLRSQAVDVSFTTAYNKVMFMTFEGLTLFPDVTYWKIIKRLTRALFAPHLLGSFKPCLVFANKNVFVEIAP